ncbi:MAG: hypothetical protein IKH88_06245 [Prevotella sp.]|nr:hypothetical protein [Prevotella sp.]
MHCDKTVIPYRDERQGMTVFGRGDGSSGATAAYGEREGIFTANVKEWEMVAATCEKE